MGGYTLGALPGQTSAGGEDAFIRKYDLNGNELWTRQFGAWLPAGYSPASDYASSVSAIDMRTKDPSSLGVYVVGNTNGVLPGQPGDASWDAFIRKYDVYGNEVWTRQVGSTNVFGPVDDRGISVSTYDGKSVYFVGNTHGGVQKPCW